MNKTEIDLIDEINRILTVLEIEASAIHDLLNPARRFELEEIFKISEAHTSVKRAHLKLRQLKQQVEKAQVVSEW